METKKNRKHCIRCGTCCLKGGPTLHHEDKKILSEGEIGYHDLITIRKGEFAYSPITESIETVHKEIVKIAGKGKGWECIFYDKNNSSCSIYPHRPLECRLLKCWDTAKLMSVISENTISRIDIIAPEDQILKFIKIHEKECTIKKAADLISKLLKAKTKSKIIKNLTSLIRRDLEIRQDAVSEFNLSLETELFYFGRPLFKLMSSGGIPVNKAVQVEMT